MRSDLDENSGGLSKQGYIYKRVQLPPEWVERLEKELDAEIVERQSPEFRSF